MSVPDLGRLAQEAAGVQADPWKEQVAINNVPHPLPRAVFIMLSEACGLLRETNAKLDTLIANEIVQAP